MRCAPPRHEGRDREHEEEHHHHAAAQHEAVEREPAVRLRPPRETDRHERRPREREGECAHGSQHQPGRDRDLSNDPIAVHRNVVFSENNQGFYINGEKFDPNRVTFSPKIGTTEEWTIHNVTKEEHPFHIHVNDLQVMSINGKKVAPASLRDTQPLPVGGTVVIRMRFTQFLGRYVFHCHILAHEDGGMMAVIDVTKDGKPSPAPTTDVIGSMPGM